MLVRDNVCFLCSPKHAVCQVPSWQAFSWADILTSVWYAVAVKIHFLFGKGVRVTTGFLCPLCPLPHAFLLEVSCDRQFEEHCVKRQLSSQLLKCYFKIGLNVLSLQFFFPVKDFLPNQALSMHLSLSEKMNGNIITQRSIKTQCFNTFQFMLYYSSWKL